MFVRYLYFFLAMVCCQLAVGKSAVAMPLDFAMHKGLGLRIATRPPAAFENFCRRNPADCVNSQKSIAEFKPSLIHTITLVNTYVNRQVKPKPDKTDIWSLTSTSGDCDDYVMTKRHLLMKLGIPASSLRVAVVLLPNNDGHAVLIVETSEGEYVLDNLRQRIMKPRQTGYRYLSVSTANVRVWSTVKSLVRPTTALASKIASASLKN